MSGIEDPGPPPELPEEYADVYREAYLRALAEAGPIEPEPVEAPRTPSRLERARAEKAARAERAREEKLRAAEERAERARVAQERAEQARLAKLRAEQERAEQVRVEKERAEQVRLENARAEKARTDAARAEQARLDEERAAQAKDFALERAEQARAMAQELAEKARLDREREQQERAEQERRDRVREDEERAAAAAAAAAAPVEPVVVAPTPALEPEPVRQRTPQRRPEPKPQQKPEPQLDRELPADPDAAANRKWLAVAAVAVVLIVAAYVAGEVISDDEPSSAGSSPVGAPTDPSVPRPSKEPTSAPSKKPTSKPSPTTALGALWDGDVTPVAVAGAEASCTAPPGVDSANQPVDYAVGNVLDDQPSTAWRCNGQARNETITFTLPAGTEVGEVGLIPGYAKDDPSSGVDRYAENNRITVVRWIISDGVVFDQELDPDPKDRSLQTVRVPRTATGQVTLQIRTVERGARNTTAISSVVIAAAG